MKNELHYYNAIIGFISQNKILSIKYTSIMYEN